MGKQNYFVTSIKPEFALVAATCFCEDNSPAVVYQCLCDEGLQDIAERMELPMDADLFDAIQSDASDYIEMYLKGEV